MKKILSSALLSLTLAISAVAASYTDNNPANVYINGLHTSYTGEFTLENYNPALEKIDSASVEFLFWDAAGNESFTIAMDGFSFAHGSIPNSLFSYYGLDFSITGLTLESLSNHGVLSYTLSLTSNFFTGFWLKNAKITAESSFLPPLAVPDTGATLALLGLGFAGLVAAKRRFAV